MPFDLADYAQLRPFLYHLTARENLPGIRTDRRLDSAATLLQAANLEADVRLRREGPKHINIGKRKVVLRDQRPLHRGPIVFPLGYVFEDFVELLNRRVFFWAGQEHGPAGPAKTYGGNHFETYSSERPVILRINFMSLMSANEGQQPLFCQYNSGAPRCSRGHHAPRGPNTFLHPAMFPKSAAGVAEVTFADHVGLPDDTMVASQFGTQWKPL